jgi:hypothetical protein
VRGAARSGRVTATAGGCHHLVPSPWNGCGVPENPTWTRFPRGCRRRPDVARVVGSAR